MTTIQNLNISRQEALERTMRFYEDKRSTKTKDELVKKIGKEWFDIFSKLGFIRCGVAVDDNGAVVETCSQSSSFKEELEFGSYNPTEKTIKFAKLLANI